MTQIIALLLAGLLCIGVAGCTQDRPEPAVPAPESLTQQLPETKPEPAPDFALMVDQTLSTLSEKITVYFVNNTGKDGCVQSIPHLERLRETGEWTEVPWKDSIGFCGMPDPLPVEGREWSENIPLLWGTLEEGYYRLSYQVGRGAEPNETVYGDFYISAPELCRLPLAEQEKTVE